MNVIALRTLRVFWERHPEAQVSIRRWHKVVSKARFENYNALKATFPRADLLQQGLIVFDVGGNGYRLVADVDFNRQVIYVKRVMTHAEYDRWNRTGRRV